MRDVDIVLLFEKAAREIDVACALKLVLERRHGLSVEIVQQNYGIPGVFRRVRPRVVVLPFCYQERSNNQYLVRWHGATFFNLTWEQLFYPGNAKAKTPRGEFAVRHVIHNAWSDIYADLLRAQGVPEAHIFISGNPAHALYDEPYRRYFKTRAALAAEHALDPARRWMFFPENYNWAFYEQVMLDQMVRDGQPAEQVREMRELATRSFEDGMRWCAAVARRDGVELIVRPRPATPVEVFERRVAEVLGRVPPHMTITQRDTVRDWILASDVVVSSYSTSLIEAAIAGKPAYIVEPHALPPSLHQHWHQYVPRLRSEGELVAAALDERPAGDGELARWARQTLMGRGDPILLVADQLARVCRRQVPIPAQAPWRSVTLPSKYHLPARLAFELRRHVITMVLPPVNRPIEDELRADVAAEREVPERVRRWEPILADYLATRGAA